MKSALHFELCLWFTFIRHNITNLRLQLSLDSPFHTSQIEYFPNILRAEVCSCICMLLSMFSGFKSYQCNHKIRNAKKGKRNRFVICTRREKTGGFKSAAIDFEDLKGSHAAGRVWSGHGVAPVCWGHGCSFLPASLSLLLCFLLKPKNYGKWCLAPHDSTRGNKAKVQEIPSKQKKG